jgi:hypothetical protein
MALSACLSATAAKSRWFLYAIAVYLGAHAILRAILFRNIEFDEAEQLLFVQSLALGYSSQPPLYTWLYWCVVQLFGPNVFSLTLVRFGLLAALYYLLYAVASRLLRDPRKAALAAACPLLIPFFAWEAVRNITHTCLMCVVCLATLLILLRIRERARTSDFVLLGLCLALGVLSKYNYVLFTLALGAAILADPSFRCQLLDRRLFLALGLASLLLLPHALWLGEHWREAHEKIMFPSRSKTLPEGFLSIAVATTLGLGLLTLTWLVFFPQGFAPRRQPGEDQETGRFLDRFFIATHTLLVLLVLFAGMRRFQIHWLAPFFLLAPIWFFSRLDLTAIPRQRVIRFAACIVLAAVGVFGARLSVLWSGYEGGKFQTRDFLYEEFASTARRAGFAEGAVIVPDPIIGGYLRMHFADSSVECLRYPACQAPPAHANEPVLLVWDATWNEAIPPMLRDHLSRLGEEIAGAKSGPTYVVVPRCKFDSSTKRLGMLLLTSRPSKG